MHNEIMLDLETIGVSNNAAILSIGAVRFDITDSTSYGSKFYVNVSVESCLKYGLQADGGTIMFWLKQADEARKVLFENPLSLELACEKFRVWAAGAKTVWGNGATFDNTILRNAFRVANAEFPIHFRGDRDVRTIVALAKQLGLVLEKQERVGQHHNALDDAMYQVQYVTKIFKAMREKK